MTAGIPTILTIENEAITVASIFPRNGAGAEFIKILIPTPIVVPPTRPAQKRIIRSVPKCVVTVHKPSKYSKQQHIAEYKPLFIKSLNPINAATPEITAPDV